MKVTKFIHACLLVESNGKVALFDPGTMSQSALPIDQLTQLDDIIITHVHEDHFSLDVIKALVAKFPDVRITAPSEVVKALSQANITATDQPSADIVFFDSPHEEVYPMYPPPEEMGVHYQGLLTHPGDSHSFSETKAVLALPVTGPWGSSVKAMKLALELKPTYVLPIHDWHWHDAARAGSYKRFEQVLGEQGITFFKLETGVPVEIDV